MNSQSEPSLFPDSKPRGLSPSLIVLFFGLVSFFGDMTYEGSRAILPSYLSVIGYTALSIGFILGLAEFIGYVVRVLAGYLVDSTRAYWVFIIFGYASLIVVPLLGLTTNLVLIFMLIFIERIAKGLRSPARDAVFSVLTKDVGLGKAFGIHEFFDQLGAFLGPSIVAIVLYYKNDYSLAFLALVIPYAFLFFLINLLYVKTRSQTARAFTVTSKEHLVKPLGTFHSRGFWYYVFSVFLNTFGLLPVMIILYLSTSLLQQWFIPMLYLIIQGVDAVSSLTVGYLYDKKKFSVLFVVFFLSVFPGAFILLFPLTQLLLILVSVFIGVILGAQESIYRARIAEITRPQKRGLAYGWFNLFYGAGFLLSGLFYGFMVDNLSFSFYAFLFLLLLQSSALFLLYLSSKA